MHCIRPEKAQAQAQGAGDAELVATDTPSPPGVTPDRASGLGAHHGTMRQVRHAQSRGSCSHYPPYPQPHRPEMGPRMACGHRG